MERKFLPFDLSPRLVYNKLNQISLSRNQGLSFHFSGYFIFEISLEQGRSQDFSKGGNTVSNNIVMAFSSRNIVGCLLKKRLTKGGGVSRAPQDPSSYALCPEHCYETIDGIESCF